MLKRILNWIAGPNGWLIADDPNDKLLAELREQGAHIPTLNGRITNPHRGGYGYHYETDKPWPPRRPRPHAEDYPT